LVKENCSSYETFDIKLGQGECKQGYFHYTESTARYMYSNKVYLAL